MIAVNGVEIAEVLERVEMLQPCENTFGAYYTMLGLLDNTNGIKRIFPDLDLRDHSVELTLLDDKDNQTKHQVKYFEADKRTFSAEKDWDKAKAPKPAPFWYNYIDDNTSVH